MNSVYHPFKNELVLKVLVENVKERKRYEVLTVSSMKLRVFWDIAPCSVAGVD
jgi:hypothetical protein